MIVFSTVTLRECLFRVLGVGTLVVAAAWPANANGALVDTQFENLGPGGSFAKQVFVYKAGRIAIDATWTAPVELTLTLLRPGGAEASQISGAGGSLTLTYSINQQELDRSVAAGDIKWRIQISRVEGAGVIGGRLKIAYPWAVVDILRNKAVKIAPPRDVSAEKSWRSETFNLLSPGTLRLQASWKPKAMLSAALTHKELGALAQKEGEGAVEVHHRVGAEGLGPPQWICAFRNLSRQRVVVTLTISFIPDR